LIIAHYFHVHVKNVVLKVANYTHADSLFQLHIFFSCKYHTLGDMSAVICINMIFT